tara:strand:+ start:440 stop:778 length:339 start_codon:yes stop_codon:yes gene_type:complete
MNGIPYGSQGADYFETGSIRVTGSYSALQGLVSRTAMTGSGMIVETTSSISYTEFESITFGRADAAGLADFTSSKIHNVRISSGDVIHGPIYAFNLLSGSCLAYKYRRGTSY